MQKQKTLKSSMDGRGKRGKGTRMDHLLDKMTNCSVVLDRVDSGKRVKVSKGEIQKK